jgi:hypothetical protein
MNPTDITEMDINDLDEFDFIQVNNSKTHISKKLSLKKLIEFIKSTKVSEEDNQI